jgi:membrane fusion protein, heavy metal efflux system
VTSRLKLEVKAERRNESRRLPFARTALTAAFVCLMLSACGRGEEPAVSNAAATTPPNGGLTVESHPRVETSLVELGSGAHDLTLVGRVAYAEDHYSRISSPLQG